MTFEHDTERLLDTWLADGPTVAPDRVLAIATARIERQRQRPAWRLQDWRLRTMSTPARLAALVGALLIAALAGSLVLTGGGGRAAGAFPALTPSPTASPAAATRRVAWTRATTSCAGRPSDPMAFAITAPGGWTGYGGFFIGGPHKLAAIRPASASRSTDDPEVVTDPCDASVHSPSPSAGAPSVDELVAALSARQDLGVSGVIDTQLAGYSGKRVDLQLPGNLSCGNQYVFAEPKGLYANGPANRWRLWILDVNGETAVVVLLGLCRDTCCGSGRGSDGHRLDPDYSIGVRRRGALRLRAGRLPSATGSRAAPARSRSPRRAP